MAFSRLVLSFALLCIPSSLASVSVPVLLWGDLAGPSMKSNPLGEVSQSEFEDILNNELKDDQFTVVFIDESLSVEDFSRKNSEGKTSFPYLKSNIAEALYLPAVENVLEVFHKYSDSNADHVTLTENGLSAEIEKENVKYLFINLRDAREGESRADMLLRHNDFIEAMVSKLQEQYDKVAAIYTGEFPSWTIPESHLRTRRATPGVFYSTALNGLRFYARDIIITSKAGEFNLTGLSGGTTNFNETVMQATLNFSNGSLILNFESKLGYWFLDSITYNGEELTTNSDVYAILGFSYRCGQTASFSKLNDTEQTTVIFRDLKVQPFFKETNSSDTPQFGDSFNCVGFFSVPIWSGLFVTFVMLAITFYGIMMMLDIRTMDRFDDPKGKTITINTVE
ncbi:V-type proton ATPase subunit S1 [Pieris napi]|uniref:V-type proton ATPase subunit S1 n=1 Tax=Pieris napi TaxID=78633 RepID=UPI001FB86FEF|nr:V-type proton ATPase subunit S1 [Pieris napi]